jgi:SnoaL-like polyketide cyclase
MTESRRIVMTHAIEVAVGVRQEDPRLLFTDDVTAWSPNLMATSVSELEKAFADRNDALSNIALVITGLDVVGNKAFAEWVLEADHTGPLMLDDIRAEPTGRRLQLGGATVAEFRGHQIESFRSYFDSTALLEQMID